MRFAYCALQAHAQREALQRNTLVQATCLPMA
jgi:hypothetical protein